LAIADVGSSEEAVATFEGIGILTPRCGTLETVEHLAFLHLKIRIHYMFIFFYFIT
jgi:hypothetical protein